MTGEGSSVPGLYELADGVYDYVIEGPIMVNAGIIVGIGDFRQGRGKGSFGTFAVAGDELGEWADAWRAITAEGRMVQLAALAKPEAADEESQELLAILQAERARRAA